MEINPRWGASIQYDPVSLLVVATAVSVGSSVMGGISANASAKREAGMQQQQAQINLDESRVAAQDMTVERNKFLQVQKLAFLKSGVSLEGSPLDVLNETRTQSQKEVDATLKRGDAQYNLGMESAQITKNKGRAALIGGFGQAASTGVSAYAAGSTAGLFNSSTRPSTKVT